MLLNIFMSLVLAKITNKPKNNEEKKLEKGEYKRRKILMDDYRFSDPNDSFVNCLLFKLFCSFLSLFSSYFYELNGDVLLFNPKLHKY